MEVGKKKGCHAVLMHIGRGGERAPARSLASLPGVHALEWCGTGGAGLRMLHLRCRHDGCVCHVLRGFSPAQHTHHSGARCAEGGGGVLDVGAGALGCRAWQEPRELRDHGLAVGSDGLGGAFRDVVHGGMSGSPVNRTLPLFCQTEMGP